MLSARPSDTLLATGLALTVPAIAEKAKVVLGVRSGSRDGERPPTTPLEQPSSPSPGVPDLPSWECTCYDRTLAQGNLPGGPDRGAGGDRVLLGRPHRERDSDPGRPGCPAERSGLVCYPGPAHQGPGAEADRPEAEPLPGRPVPALP